MKEFKMAYKKCPKCGINYILENEDYCDVCKTEMGLISNKTITNRKRSDVDFSRIIRGCVYGTNSRSIYKEFCNTLGWDRHKINQFGWQKPLYAENADTNRTSDVKCTPKVRQTLGGAFNYAKEETQHKILAGVQDICYNGYAREPFRI